MKGSYRPPSAAQVLARVEEEITVAEAVMVHHLMLADKNDYQERSLAIRKQIVTLQVELTEVEHRHMEAPSKVMDAQRRIRVAKKQRHVLKNSKAVSQINRLMAQINKLKHEVNDD